MLSTDQVALDGTVVKVNGEQFWLFGAVDPETGRILHIRLFPHRTIVTTKIFLDGLVEKHAVDDAEFLATKHRGSSRVVRTRTSFRHETFGDRNPVD